MAQEFTEYLKTDKNGTKYYADYRCSHCGGAGGADAWIHTGYTCWSCGGTGRRSSPTIFKVYTPEYEAILKEKRLEKKRKAMEKELADLDAHIARENAKFFQRNGFTADGITFAFLGDTYSIKEELKAEGAKWDWSDLGWHADHKIKDFPCVMLTADQILLKRRLEINGEEIEGEFNSFNQEEITRLVNEAKTSLFGAETVSQHVGTVGDKIEIKAELTSVHWYDTRFNYRTITNWIYTFKDETGNVFVWKTTACINEHSGDHVILKGTIKAHGEYNGIKQTELQRCKITKEES